MAAAANIAIKYFTSFDDYNKFSIGRARLYRTQHRINNILYISFFLSFIGRIACLKKKEEFWGNRGRYLIKTRSSFENKNT